MPANEGNMKKYLRGVSSFLTQNKTKMMTGLAQQLALPIAFLLVNWLLRAAAKPPNIVFFLADDVGFRYFPWPFTVLDHIS